jgi:hypothetical protein
LSYLRKKAETLNQALCEIEKILQFDVEYGKKMLIRIENIFDWFGYEAGYNRTIGLKGAEFVNQPIPKLVELGEKIFEGKELLPFLREKLWITNEEPARSNLYKKIHELEKE